MPIDPKQTALTILLNNLLESARIEGRESKNFEHYGYGTPGWYRMEKKLSDLRLYTLNLVKIIRLVSLDQADPTIALSEDFDFRGDNEKLFE